jgi:di/tricarboxylate transporter
MGERIGQWLVGQFALFGIPFQNWMAVALAIVVLWMLGLWFAGWFGDRE